MITTKKQMLTLPNGAIMYAYLTKDGHVKLTFPNGTKVHGFQTTPFGNPSARASISLVMPKS